MNAPLQPQPGQVTPGPWDWETAGTFSANGSFHLYLIDPQGRKIAALWGKEGEKVANAIAISALPDMVATLEEIARLGGGEVGDMAEQALRAAGLRQ